LPKYVLGHSFNKENSDNLVQVHLLVEIINNRLRLAISHQKNAQQFCVFVGDLLLIIEMHGDLRLKVKINFTYLKF
jgi:hypothetical protein